jgi:hypothetical protein
LNSSLKISRVITPIYGEQLQSCCGRKPEFETSWLALADALEWWLLKNKK